MKLEKILIGLLVVAFGWFVFAGPADAAKPKTGFWFSEMVNPEDENNLSSIQFDVVAGGKKLRKLTIYWQCGKKSGYHKFTNLPIPIRISKKGFFKVVGAASAPSGTTMKDFTLKGRFITRKKARYSMKLEACGPATKGKLIYAED